MNQFVENSLNQVNSKKVSTDMRVLLASLTHPSPPLRKMGGGETKSASGASGKMGPEGPTGQQGPRETKGDTRHSFSEMLSIFVLTYQDHPSTTVIITKYRVLNRCQK